MTLAIEDSSIVEKDPTDDSRELNSEAINNRQYDDDSDELFA